MRKAAGTLLLMTAGVLSAAGSLVSAGQTDREKALASLIEAERSFSRTSEEKGIREAFLTFLAENAIVFRPGPVEGRPVYEKMSPDNPAVLTWRPEVAEVSAAGDLGYTSGPYEVRPNRGAEPTGFGHYVSIWKKQADGTWKVFLDIGVQHGRPAAPYAMGSVATPRAGDARQALSPEALRDEGHVVGNRAGAFESAVGGYGLRKTLATFATDDIRIYRPGRFPAIGKAIIKDIIPANAGRVNPGSKQRRGHFQVEIAWSGDLACTYGTSEYWKTRSIVETSAILKIWRKELSGVWDICLEIEIPIPPPGKTKN